MYPEEEKNKRRMQILINDNIINQKITTRCFSQKKIISLDFRFTKRERKKEKKNNLLHEIYHASLTIFKKKKKTTIISTKQKRLKTSSS